MPQKREYTQDHLDAMTFAGRSEFQKIFNNQYIRMNMDDLVQAAVDWWNKYPDPVRSEVFTLEAAAEIFALVNTEHKNHQAVQEIFKQVMQWHTEKQKEALDISKPVENQNAFLSFVMDVLTRMSRRDTR